MEDIKLLTENLGQEILKSKIYSDYIYYKDKLEEDALKAVKEFKKKQFNIGLRKAEGINVPIEEEKAFEHEKFNLCSNKDIEGFLNSEKLVVDMLAGVYERLGEIVKIDLDYIE